MTVIGRDYNLEKNNRKSQQYRYYKCQCDCGNIVSKSYKNLLSGHTKSCGCLRKKVTDEELLLQLKNVIEKYDGNIVDVKHLEKYGLFSWTTYRNRFGGIFYDWYKKCGAVISKNGQEHLYKNSTFNKSFERSKENAISIILQMQKKLGRPLKYDDFRSPKKNEVGISTIKKYWGTVNKMKDSLGLQIIQESMMEKHLTQQRFDYIVEKIQKNLMIQNRDWLTTREIPSLAEGVRYTTLQKACKKYHQIEFSNYIKKFGLHFGKSGIGNRYIFPDGEETTSYYEYLFSSFLRSHGLKYNYDYFRDIKYKSFIPGYKNNMNCDYVIFINGGTIYIEIAGLIANYKMWYYQDKPITASKNKEIYRKKLKEKEIMLLNNGLNYFFLFPCDLTQEIFELILSCPTQALREKIQNFYKSNINWKKVKEQGELKYYSDKLSSRGQKVVDYN